ncbi:MAG: hypothetical protein JW958_13325 [Candidatus Eisenbacteria bacterium]|nr:hypothetical protein [Candidatus Eisenbacteria bacterium]
MKHKMIWTVLSAALLAGCASQAPPPAPPDRAGGGTPAEEREPMERIRITASESEEPLPLPEHRPVSVVAREAEIRNVLFAVAEQAGLDLVLDSDVQGRVTLEVQKIPIQEALDAIIEQAGFTYTIRNGLLRVHGDGLQTRIFTVDYVTGVRTGQTRLAASSGGSQDAQTSSSGGSDGESRVQVDLETSADPWADIIAGLEKIVFDDAETGVVINTAPGLPLGAGRYEGRAGAERLVVNPLSGIVMVTAPFAKLNRVADFLERIEGSAHRQVLIEARIFEVSLSEEFHQGIDWSRIPGTGNNVQSVFGNDDGAAAQRLSPQNAVFEIAWSEGDFDIVLDALASQGDVKVVSSPRLASMNNQKAIIKVAREESFFSQRIDYETNSDGTTTPIFTVEPERVTIGLVLDVTPQISADGEIMMNIHPSLTELVGEDVFPPGATGADVLANAPVLDIREVDTVVRVRNNNTLIIGGLMKDRATEQVSMVPFLGKIPVLGHLFRRTDKVTTRVELVITLRPQLVVGEDADRYARSEMDRLGGK